MNIALRFRTIVISITVCQGSFGCASRQNVDVDPDFGRTADVVFVGKVVDTSLQTLHLDGIQKDTSRDVTVVVVKLLRPFGEAARVEEFLGGWVLLKDDSVGVRFEERPNVSVGETLIVAANIWLIGSRILLRGRDYQKISGVPDTVPTEWGLTEIRYKRDVRDIAERVQGAGAVIFGSVEVIAESTLPELGIEPRHSEHEPSWREADVRVREVIFGDSVIKDALLVIRFPTNRQGVWGRAPKLIGGLEAIFILRADSISGASVAIRNGARVPAFTSLDKWDVITYERWRDLSVR